MDYLKNNANKEPPFIHNMMKSIDILETRETDIKCTHADRETNFNHIETMSLGREGDLS